jgi:hypothetical protein
MKKRYSEERIIRFLCEADASPQAKTVAKLMQVRNEAA